MPRVIVGNKDPIGNSSSGKFEGMKYFRVFLHFTTEIRRGESELDLLILLSSEHEN